MHGDAEYGDESDEGRHAQRKAGDQEEKGAAHQRDGDIENDRQRVAQASETGVDQNENENESDRNGDRQTMVGFLCVLELAAPGYEITGRQFDLIADGDLSVLNKASDVAALDIALYNHTPKSVLAVYDRIAGRKLERGKLTERNAAADRRGD